MGFSLWRRDDRFQGSVSEPDPRSRRLKAGCHAGRALQIGAGTSPGTRARPRFRHRCKVSTLHQRFTFVRLRGPYLTRSWPRLLTRRSPRRLLIAAARADLQPDSASRLREACSHLRHSFLLHTARLFQNEGAKNALMSINMKSLLTTVARRGCRASLVRRERQLNLSHLRSRDWNASVARNQRAARLCRAPRASRECHSMSYEWHGMSQV